MCKIPLRHDREYKYISRCKCTSERERNLYSSAFFVSYNFYLRRDLERARENHERDRGLYREL